MPNGDSLSLLGKPAPPPISLAPAYMVQSDATLTASQSRRGQFAPGSVRSGSYRGLSNPTLHGYSTGYHESFLITDLRDALVTGKEESGGYRLNFKSGNKFASENATPVNLKMRAMLLNVGDSFRTDTAQTILSGEGGTGAGHSGSNITSGAGQIEAHDLVRRAVIQMLRLDPDKNSGITEKAVAVVGAAITTASIAPGAVARTVPGGTATLKDQSAIDSWESRRNEMKARTHALYHDFSPQEQKFVDGAIEPFMESLQEGVAQSDKRWLQGPTSPRRNSMTVLPHETSGGGYLPDDNFSLAPSEAPPLAPEHVGFYITQQKRDLRIFLPPGDTADGENGSLKPSSQSRKRTLSQDPDDIMVDEGAQPTLDPRKKMKKSSAPKKFLFPQSSKRSTGKKSSSRQVGIELDSPPNDDALLLSV